MSEFVTVRRPWLIGLMVLAAAVYAAMWIGWEQRWGWLAAVDASTLAVGQGIGADRTAWVIGWDVVCTVLSPVTFRLLTFGLIVYALVRHQRRVALFLVVTVELSAVLTEVAKRLAERDRPETAMASAWSSSFPSGHALGTMVAVLALAAVVLPHVRRNLRPWLIAAGAFVVVAVGLGRVALNVHHLSDVLAGWSLGYVYFAGALLAFDPERVTAVDETPAAPGTPR